MVRLSAFSRVLPALGFLGLGGAISGSAQTPAPTQAWEMRNLRARWCVYYLMDSATADKKLPGGYVPRVASGFPGLSPAVARQVRDDSTYSSWIPAQLCTVHFDEAAVDGRAVGDSSVTAGDAQILATWLIGARAEADNDPSAATYYVVTLRSSNWRLLRQGEIWLMKGENANSVVGKVPESTEDLYQVRIGRTAITWEGHLAGDSALSAPPVEERWYIQSTRNSRITGQVTFRASQAQSIAGTLRIEGKDDLAKSLRESPVRMVGPMLWGGGGVITFSR